PAAGQSGTAVITVTVTDSAPTGGANANSFSQQFTVTVASTNVAPIVTTTPGSAAYIQGRPAVVVDSNVSVSNGSPPLVGPQVRITGNFAAGQDVLGFIVANVFAATYSQNGIVGSYNPATGVLTLTGNASLGAYRTALDSVAYLNTITNPLTLTRTVTFVADD